MNTRVNPNILQYTGIVFWLLAMLFHQSLVFKGDNQVSELSNIIYLIIIGTFAVSFYKYYDLTISQIGRKDIFSVFYKLFIYSIKTVMPILVLYIIYFFEIGGNLLDIPSVIILSNDIAIGISILFLTVNFTVLKRLIFFESASIMKTIFVVFQYGLLLMFLLDIFYNLFPTDLYQYALAALFLMVGILFFNQKWVAYMPFNQKWKTILFSIFILLSLVLIYQVFDLLELFYNDLFNIKSSLFFVLLFGFSFTYISVAILINVFNLPTSPVFDYIQNERIIAKKVQENLIPNSLPNTKKLKIYSSYLPHFALGGDYFDYIPIGKNKFLICIADVSGKGIPAALMMSNVQASLRTMARNTNDLKKIVEELNYQITLRGLSERFVSIFICTYDFKSKKLEYVNCGHPHPIILHDKKIETLDKGSTVLGMFQKLPSLIVTQIKISSGFNLFCYTDGLTETQNDLGEFYGSKKIKELFKNKKSSPDKIIDLVLEDLKKFKGNNLTEDDITLLMAKIRND